MRYIRFEEGKKERCLKALASLKNNELFEEVLECMVEPTRRNAAQNCQDMPTDDINLGPEQGVARVMKELTDLCRDPRSVGRNKK